ncbi:MAG: LPS translocon maturation chaperone LptM [Bdellovibrio bacteriovorus]
MICFARYLLIFVVVALGVLSVLGACGRKGPLYLPEQGDRAAPAAQSEVPRTPVAPPAPEQAQP